MNSLKPALRHLRKYPAFSLINLGGLTAGLTVLSGADPDQTAVTSRKQFR